jgi:acyl carrier protein
MRRSRVKGATVVDEVRTAIATVLNIDASELGETTAAGDLQEWDSFGHLMVIAELETRFATKFSIEEILSARTVSDLANLLDARRGAASAS